MLAFFTQGELLLTLEGQDGRLLARWGAIGIGCAPEVCFAKSGKAVAACGQGERRRRSSGNRAGPQGGRCGLERGRPQGCPRLRRALPCRGGAALRLEEIPPQAARVAKAYQQVGRPAQPLFARWAQTFDAARRSPADRTCFAELARHGMPRP
ncbi:MAG: hypothetical protein K6E40_02275 [Desulfovibrio sp.]|nr:hypothetical protein [Desulfovibrio sp.]